jgi:hypothetical protein
MASAVTHMHLEFGRSLGEEELMQEALSFLEDESARERQAREHLLQAKQARAAAVDGGGHRYSTPSLSTPFMISGRSERARLLMPRKRATLDEASVIRIFEAKHLSNDPGLRHWLASQHGVTEKAVRDIWTGRTWRRVTEPYLNASGNGNVGQQPVVLPANFRSVEKVAM